MHRRFRIGFELEQAARYMNRVRHIAALREIFGFANVDDERAAISDLSSGRLQRDAGDSRLGGCKQLLDAPGSWFRRRCGQSCQRLG